MKRIALYLALITLIGGGNLFAADKLKVVTATEDPASITRERVWNRSRDSGLASRSR